MNACPLCSGPDIASLAEVQSRRYLACEACGLAFMDRLDLPTRSREREIYALHRNDPEDLRYRAFLDRLALPLAERLRPGMSGLDYGAGPGPALVRMLCERGYPTVAWDPLYAPCDALLAARYDFVTCTEVAEHFHRPREEFDRMASLLRPDGWLAVMTQWRPADHDFAAWHYLRDPTHVSLYGEPTFRWIAGQYGYALEMPAPNVALLRASA